MVYHTTLLQDVYDYALPFVYKRWLCYYMSGRQCVGINQEHNSFISKLSTPQSVLKIISSAYGISILFTESDTQVLENWLNYYLHDLYYLDEGGEKATEY